MIATYFTLSKYYNELSACYNNGERFAYVMLLIYANLIICGMNISYVVNIESWSPSNSAGSPSNSIVYIPTMSATPTDLDNIGKKHM